MAKAKQEEEEEAKDTQGNYLGFFLSLSPHPQHQQLGSWVFFVLTLYLIISPHSRFSLFDFTQFFEIKQHSKSFGSFLPFLQIKGAKKTTPVWFLFELVLLKHKLFKHWFPTGDTMFLAAGQGFYEKIYFLPKFLILVDAPKGLCTKGRFLLLFKKFFFV